MLGSPEVPQRQAMPQRPGAAPAVQPAREPTPDFSPMQISPAPQAGLTAPSPAPALPTLRRRPLSAAAARVRVASSSGEGSSPAAAGINAGPAHALGGSGGRARPGSGGGGGNARGLESVAALELLGDCAAAEAAAAKRARGAESLQARRPPGITGTTATNAS